MATTTKPTAETDEPAGAEPELPPARVFAPDEVRAIFESEAQRVMGMGGDEFVRRWEAGEFRDVFDTPGHIQMVDLVMMIPLVRQVAG